MRDVFESIAKQWPGKILLWREGMHINLGDKAKDSVSGFQGIAVARYEYLNGCTRVCLQPPVGRDGKLPDTATFDEPQLIFLGRPALPKRKTDTGGPEKYPDVRRY